MSEIEKYYNGEIIVDFEEETELEKKYNEVAELYSKAVKKKIEYRKEIERLNNIINELEKDAEKIISVYGKGKYENSYELGLLEYAETDLRKIQELKGVDKE